MSKDIIVITGVHGSGKSHFAKETAKALSPDYSIEHLSIGDTIRSIARGAIKSYHMSAIRDHLNSPRANQLLDNEIIYRVMTDALSAHDNTDTLLLDGFPRTTPQVQSLGELALLHSRPVRGIIRTTVPDHKAAERMLKRSPRDYDVSFDEASAYQKIAEDKVLFSDMALELNYPTLPYAIIDTSGSKPDTTQAGVTAIKQMLDHKTTY